MRNSRILLLLFFILAGGGAYSQLSQISQIDGLSGLLINKLRSSASEKIFVQTDRSFYNTGEKIWFKVYCLNGASGKPVYTPKTLYADLVNDRDSTVARLMLHNETGNTDGYITIPFSINSGHYLVRGYSKKALQNINSIFAVPVYIYNPYQPDEYRPAGKHAAYQNNNRQLLELFPEGGSLIAGINCVTAFRVYDKDGNPADASGYVTDNRDTVTTTFQTAYPGLGKFNFEVWANRKYTVHIKDKDKGELTYPLPPIRLSSAQISVTGDNNNELNVQVALGDSIYNRNYASYLLCVSGDSLCFAAAGKGMYTVGIPKKDIPAGKATLLLFNEKNQLLSERNVYIAHHEAVSLDIKTDKTNYKARDKINMTVAVTGSAQRVEPALLSVSVTNDALVNQGIYKPVITDLRYSTIDLPDKQFAADKIKNYTAEQWDLVMLTQKNNYLELWNNSISAVPADSTDEMNMKKITGRIVDNDDIPVDNISVSLTYNRLPVTMTQGTTDLKGRFYFQLPYLPEDSTLFILRTEDGPQRKLKILVDDDLFPMVKTPQAFKTAAAITPEQIARAIKMQTDSIINAKGKALKEVTVSTKTTSSRQSNVITGKDLAQGMGSISNAILSVPGVQLKGGYVIIRGGTDMFHLNAGSEPIVVINGVATSGEGTVTTDGVTSAGMGVGSPVLQMLEAIPINTIDNITVLTGADAAIYGARGGNGAIVVTTTTINQDLARPVPGQKSVEKKIYKRTYFKPSLFPEPDYANKGKGKIPVLDYQPTVYWNGSKLTDKDGKAVYDFYAADRTSVYTVTVTGVTAKGNLVYAQTKINQ